MKKLLGVMILGLVCFFIQPTKVQSSDLATDILGAVLDKSKQNKLELQKWNLPKKDLVGLKSKEIKSLLSGNFILSEWNDNEIKGRAEDIFYEDGTYEAVLSGERIDSGEKVSLKEKGTWSAKQGKLCFKGIETVNNEEFDYSGCVKVLKSKTNPNVYFLRHQGLIYQKFVKIITNKDRIEEEKKAEEKKTEEEKKQIESSQDKTAEDVSVGKNIKHKTVDLRNGNKFQFYTKDFMEDKIIDNFISIMPCRGASTTAHTCGFLDPNISASYHYANFAVRKPYNLHWYMLNYGGTKADQTHSQNPAIITLGKNWALYKDPRWKIKHNQKVCEPVLYEELTKGDCVDGVSILTFDISFIKGRGVLGPYDNPSVGTIIKPIFNTGLGDIQDEIFPSSDKQDKHWRKKLSFVFKKNNRYYKKINTDSLFGNPWEKTIAFMYPVVKVGDPLVKNFPGFEGHYLSYVNYPWGALMVSVGLDERIGEEKQHHADTLLANIVFDVVENGKRTIPGTGAQDIAKKWEELSILGEDLKKCLNDNKTDFDKLENCSKSYEKSTRKIIDWKENQWNHEGNKGSIFNLAIVKLFPPKNGDTTSITRGLISDVQSESRYEIEPIEEGVRSFWTVTACIDDEVKKVEYETDLDIISILEQNCFQLLDKNIAFNKEISQKLKEVKVIKKTKKEKGWIGIKYEEVTKELAQDVGLIKITKKKKDMTKNPGWVRVIREEKQISAIIEKLDKEAEAGKVRNEAEEKRYQFYKVELKQRRDKLAQMPVVFDKVIVTDCPTTLSCGVIVKRVYKDSPADKAGIKVDDIILQYNGKSMKDSTNVRASVVFETLVDDTFAGQEVSLKIWRNEEELIKKITLGILEKRLDYNAR